MAAKKETPKTDTCNHLEYWNSVEQVPIEFLKEIKGGRLKGKTDISPMWRLWQLTEKHGPCGCGWYYKLIDWKYIEAGGEASIQAHIELYIADWMPITGVGGSKILKKESGGTYHDDEALKCAVTDAISVACKQLGYASAIYEGRFDGSKYKDRENVPATTAEKPQKPASTPRSKPAPALIDPAEKQKILAAFKSISIDVSTVEELIGKPQDEWLQTDVSVLRSTYMSKKG